MGWRKKLLTIIEKKLKKDSTGHNMDHHLRTEKYALLIAKNEGGLDEETLSAASLIHDVGRIDEFSGIDHIEVGVKFAKIWLSKIGFPRKKIPKVIEAIELHEQRPEQKIKKKARHKETLVIQDADKMDFLGAIGLARGFQFAGAHNIPVYNPKYKLKPKYAYKPLEKIPSELHMFIQFISYKFNTKFAEKMAKKRLTFVNKFVSQFLKEWEGKL